ncbi:unnamed protein product [Ilex paraguariensis]|uniref:Uncharacterized protein n=1 Tax=Ilex paraguariensis TaxID=185542 RepID=A0ABC8SJS5_9AQUA
MGRVTVMMHASLTAAASEYRLEIPGILFALPSTTFPRWFLMILPIEAFCPPVLKVPSPSQLILRLP